MQRLALGLGSVIAARLAVNVISRLRRLGASLVGGNEMLAIAAQFHGFPLPEEKVLLCEVGVCRLIRCGRRNRLGLKHVRSETGYWLRLKDLLEQRLDYRCGENRDLRRRGHFVSPSC